MENIILFSIDDLRKVIREEIGTLQSHSDLEAKKRFFIEEAAEYVKLPVPSFRIHQYKIGGVKIGRRWTFTKGELDGFIESHSRRR